MSPCKLENILNRSSRLRNAYQWKEEFRDIYERSRTVKEGKLRLEEWLDKTQAVYSDVITTIRNYLDGRAQLLYQSNYKRCYGRN